MSIARKLVLLAGLALTALALTATSASAQTPVEVVEETNGQDCVDCPIHATGEAVITREDGIPVSTCVDEFEGTIDADGSGEIEWLGVDHTPAGPGCNVRNCISPEDHWTTHSLVELPSGHEQITVEFCLRNPQAGVDSHCTADVEIEEESPHHYILSLTNQECPAAGGNHVFITGEWEIENEDTPQHPALELEHHG